MKKINLLIMIGAATISCLVISCNKSITEPEKRIKTPREMAWIADTLTSPDPTSIQLMMENILAFSPDDLWVCGWSDVARGLIWHYDGTKWKESNIVADVGGMRVSDIAGYSSNDLWTAGYSGDYIFLAHYDGYRWTRQNNMNIKGELLDMSKDPSGNIWACGRNGVIMKFDKTKWITDTIKINHSFDSYYWLRRVEYFRNKIYIIATVADSKKEIHYYISGDVNNWTIMDSMIIDSPSSIIKWGNRGIYSSTYGKLYSFGLSGSWVYEYDNWKRLYNSDASIIGMYGISENYLIAVGDFQQVLFYNGSNWENVVDLFHLIDQHLVFTNVWTNGYETFIIGYGFISGSIKTIIFHGK